jgi:hypothetical protein
MARYRSRELTINLAPGAEIRLADAPTSEPIRNLTVVVVPWQLGNVVPAGAGVVWNVYYGGGHDKPAKASGPTYNTGVSQANGTLAAASKIPVTLWEDTSLLPEDRVLGGPQGLDAKVTAGTARAVHLINNSNTVFNCKVKFISECVASLF